MRYCPHCRRLNPGHPEFCHYCGRTWHVRLCPRGHPNPANAQYCGTCGAADLTETAGPRPWSLYFIKFLILCVLCIGGFFIANLFFLSLRGTPLSLILRYVLIFTFLWVGYLVASSILPGPIKKWSATINKFLIKVMKRMLTGLLQAIKDVINLIMKW